MKNLLLLLLLANLPVLYAQTGPAGVGTSANNVLWLRADAGTNTTTNGANVTYWNDNSGNMNSVYQPTVSQQPLYETNIMNGYPAIQFDNVSTTNDKLLGFDSPTLDNTAGYTFFTVSRPQTVDGNARVIVSKRTTVSVDQSFMLFYYTGNKFHVDIQTVNDRYPTASSFTANTNYIIDQVYDGTLPTASRCKTYIGESLDATSSETSASVPDNASPLIIGSTDATDPRPYGGYISEILIYRTALNDAQRIIVNNYLSAKYNIALTANDKYAGDNTVNGDYDRDVAGVGKESSGVNTSFSSSASAGLGISVNSGLDNGDYIMAGHASAVNGQITTDVAGMTGTANARWQRIWYFDITNTSTTLNTNIEFDMSDGLTWILPLGAASNYVLLYRAGQTGAWTELATASAVSGDKVLFNSYTLTTDGYYTIGTHDLTISPLPIELLSFDANMNSGKVDLTWETASETNNSYFTVEKSRDGITFNAVSRTEGAGNSSSILRYADTDYDPYDGISYYRLKQTDVNGRSSYSQIVSVNYYFGEDQVSVYPNPSDGSSPLNLKLSGLENQQVLVVVRDMAGNEFYSKVILSTQHEQLEAIDTENRLRPGTYIIVASSSNRMYSQKIVIK
jgi:hypothetical protein